ncbi:MAG: RDD family protein [bacterium]|nr:RDD family protein [bacterium]
MKNSDGKNGLFFQRILAFVVDIFIVSFFASILCTPFLDYDSIDNLNQNANEVVSKYMEDEIDTETYIDSAGSILYRLTQKQGPLTLITIFLNILYFVVFQFYFKGQTIGKKLFGIKVVSNDTNELSMNNYIYRSLIVNSLVVDTVAFAFVIFASKDVWLYAIMLLVVINYTILFISLFMIIFRKDGRGLHDLVANTKVISCRK